MAEARPKCRPPSIALKRRHTLSLVILSNLGIYHSYLWNRLPCWGHFYRAQSRSKRLHPDGLCVWLKSGWGRLSDTYSIFPDPGKPGNLRTCKDYVSCRHKRFLFPGDSRIFPSLCAPFHYSAYKMADKNELIRLGRTIVLKKTAYLKF